MNNNSNSEFQFKAPEVFIVSSGRSGTTLLTLILNATKQVHIPYESDFIARAYPFYKQAKSFSHVDYQQIAKLFCLTSKEQGWGMTEEYIIKYLSNAKPKNFSEINSTIYKAFYDSQGTENLKWGIKAPVLISSLERILDTFPKAKIIHIIRDGRDVYLSYKNIHKYNQIKFGPKGIITNALYWVDGLRRIHEFKNKNNFASQVYELRYEDLLLDPDTELKKICNFLSINYNPLIYTDFHDLKVNKKVVPQKFTNTIHKKAKSSLDPKNTQKYLHKISNFDKFVFELVASPWLDNFGYKIHFPFLKSKFLFPFRVLIYLGARKINDWRYHKRDINFYQKIKPSN